ncbi:MAG: hypothetical protein R6V10_08055 [bacterium]
MNKNRFKNRLLVAGLVLTVTLALCGCSNQEEEVKKRINQEISLIENEIEALEKHQKNMRSMISRMETELQAMRAELKKEAPRIEAAKKGTMSLRDLNQNGLGESPATSVMKNPAWNVLWVLFFILLLWLFYRFRVKASTKSK